MSELKPYARFKELDLILRDELAVDRTLLANERTLLAYLRSSVALVIAGISILHFALGGWFLWMGIICIPLGILTGVFGVIRFFTIHKTISIVRRSSNSMPDKSAASVSPDAE